MPFTPAHVVAVFPLRKIRFFSLSGLIIGSMVPDYEYFVRMTLYGHYGHTLRGILLFDLPMGLLLYVVYHALVRRQLVGYLPQVLYSRFACAENYAWKSLRSAPFARILLSILTGTLTHFIWDGFTHDEEYYFARYLHGLLQPIHLAGWSVPLHLLLQGLSSVIGLIVLYVYIMHLPQSGAKQYKPARQIWSFWIGVGVLSIIIGMGRWMLGMPDEKLIGQLIVVSISAFHLGLLLVCTVLHLCRQKIPAVQLEQQ